MREMKGGKSKDRGKKKRKGDIGREKEGNIWMGKEGDMEWERGIVNIGRKEREI